MLIEWHSEVILYSASSPAVSLVVCAGLEPGDLREPLGIAYYLTNTQTTPVLSPQTLTVKDLLLSNLGHTVRDILFQNTR